MSNQLIIRSLDVFFSLTALIILFPILLCIIIILRITGEGEIFYFQKRIGLNKNLFSLIKFATMKKNSESIGNKTITVRNDPRVLPFGKFLRKTKINELPQLINILIGDMSVVGPRPLLQKQFSFYSIEVQNIISVKRPGLTGMGSLIFRDEERLFDNVNNADATYQQKISPLKGFLEVNFVENYSIYLYFKLIFLTVVALVFPKISLINFFEVDIREKYDEILG